MVKLKGFLRKKLEKPETKYPQIFIKEPKQFIVLPSTKDMTKINIKYPLLEPFAYAQIRWSENDNKLIYNILEPVLTEEDKKIFKKIKEVLTELIDVKVSVIKNRAEAINYIEKKVRSILDITKIKMESDRYVKVMYYIIRDFVGINEIEPIMHDPYIEDIGCTGVNSYIYVVHRKFGSLETNITYSDIEKLTNYVIKLSEKCGRYISYARPILDGSLPDGSRVQASIAKDVTTKGPTFSIRKFRKNPYSPIDMLILKTTSPPILAYLWFLLEHNISILVSGGVSTGKTTLLNILSMFIHPEKKIVSIEDTREINLSHENWVPSVARTGFGVPEAGGKRYGEVDMFDLLKESFRMNPDYIIVGEIRGKEAYVMFQGMSSIPGKENVAILNDNHLKIMPIKDVELKNGFRTPTFDMATGKVSLLPISRKVEHRPIKDFYKMTTKSGREIIVTKNHSLFTYDNGFIPIEASNLKTCDSLLIPAKLPCGYNDIKYLNLLDILSDARVYSPEHVKEAVRRLGFYPASSIVGVRSISDYYSNFSRSKCSSLKVDKFVNLMRKAKINYNLDDLVIKYDNKGGTLPAKLSVTPEFLRLLGYIISEGSLSKSKGINRICLYSKDKAVLRDMRHCIEIVSGTKPNQRVTRGFGYCFELSIHNKALSKLLKILCGTGKTDRKIPSFIFGLSKKRIGQFISGLYTGDGTLTKKYFGYYTISKKLANDLAYLLLTFGIVVRIRNRKRENRKTTDYELLFYKRKDMDTFLKYIKYIGKTPHLTKQGKPDLCKISDIYVDKIKLIEKIRLKNASSVYDFSVTGTQNFIGGFGGVILHNSGHPSIGTMHAGSIEDVIKRLEAPPIELSASLIESLDILIVMTNSTDKGKSVRRVKEVVEIQSIDRKTGKAHTIRTFNWIPSTDKFKDNSANSEILRRISFETGHSYLDIVKEIKKRKEILEWMKRNDIVQFSDVTNILNMYYREPKTVLKWVENNTIPTKLQLKTKLKKKWEPSTDLEIISD